MEEQPLTSPLPNKRKAPKKRMSIKNKRKELSSDEEDV
jgi:hypothetical protein